MKKNKVNAFLFFVCLQLFCTKQRWWTPPTAKAATAEPIYKDNKNWQATTALTIQKNSKVAFQKYTLVATITIPATETTQQADGEAEKLTIRQIKMKTRGNWLRPRLPYNFATLLCLYLCWQQQQQQQE